MSDSSPTVVNVAERLTLLEERRAALQRIIKITQSLEGLQQGLLTVSNLRDTSKGFPEDALRTFEALGRKVRNLSDAEIKIRLDNLDQKVKTKLKLVLELADELDVSVAQSADGVRLDIVNQLVDEFKKHAQTAIALRVLLEKRGIAAPALELNVPQQTIRQQLDQISSRESQCRGEVVRQVDDMQAEVKLLLLSPSLKPALQAILQAMLEALQANLEHLKSGKPVSALPVPIADIAIDVTPFSGVGLSEPEPVPTPAEQNPNSGKPADASSTKPSAAASAKPTERPPTQPPQAPQPKGFWARFIAWLNTPWHVRWKDIDRK